MELPHPLRGEPGRHPEVRKATLPALENPVTTVGGSAAGDVPGELRACVRATDVPDVLPERGPELHVAARVIPPECNLGAFPARRASVDRAPEDRVEPLGTHRVVDDGMTLRIDLHAHVLGVSGDDLARGGRGNGEERDQSGG